jgi:excisionase family DNA binding protein
MTVSAAANFLGVSPSTLRNWDREGKLKAIRHPINRYRLYRKLDLQQLLKRMRPK